MSFIEFLFSPIGLLAEIILVVSIITYETVRRKKLNFNAVNDLPDARELTQGEIGEMEVRHILSSLDSMKYRIFNDLYIRDAEGGTTQIDHLIVSVYGIFVIETKNYSGTIYGNADYKSWTQFLGNKKYKFKNPIHQNYGHVQNVKSLIGEQYEYKSLVCFSDKSIIKGIESLEVTKCQDLLQRILTFTSETISREALVNIEARIYNNAIPKSKEVEDSHVNYVQSKINNKALRNKKENPKVVDGNVIIHDDAMQCPKCGNNLVVRQSSRGEFLGCSTFPKCWYRRSLQKIN